MMSDRAPSQRYRMLGILSERVGPFGLLGLQPDGLTREAIMRAMYLQLARIDAHPQSHTSQADELRREVLTAANLLLDERSRNELCREFQNAVDAPSMVDPTVEAGGRSRATEPSAPYESIIVEDDEADPVDDATGDHSDSDERSGAAAMEGADDDEDSQGANDGAQIGSGSASSARYHFSPRPQHHSRPDETRQRRIAPTQETYVFRPPPHLQTTSPIEFVTQVEAETGPVSSAAAGSTDLAIRPAAAASHSSSPVRSGGGPARRIEIPAPDPMEQEFITAWISAGGWNTSARQRMLVIAARHGLSGADMMKTIARLPEIISRQKIAAANVAPPPPAIPIDPRNVLGDLATTSGASIKASAQHTAGQVARQVAPASPTAAVSAAALLPAPVARVSIARGAWIPESGSGGRTLTVGGGSAGGGGPHEDFRSLPRIPHFEWEKQVQALKVAEERMPENLTDAQKQRWLEEEEQRLSQRNFKVLVSVIFSCCLFLVPFGLYILSAMVSPVSRVTYQPGNPAIESPPTVTSDAMEGLGANNAGSPGGSTTGNAGDASPAHLERMPTTWQVAVKELGRKSLTNDPFDVSTASQLAGAIVALRQIWFGTIPEDRQQMVDLLSSLLYRNGANDDAVGRIVAAISANLEDPMQSPDGFAQRVWTGTMLIQLLRQPEMPPNAVTMMTSALNRYIGATTMPAQTTMDAAVAQVLRSLSPQVVTLSTLADNAGDASSHDRPGYSPAGGGASGASPSVTYWITYLECVDTIVSQETRDRLCMDGAELLLMKGPETSSSPSVQKSLTALLGHGSWSSSNEGRQRILSWFDDPRVSSGDLNIVTGFLVGTARIRGLDSSFVLAADSNSQQRAAARDRLAQAWKTQGDQSGLYASQRELLDWLTRAKAAQFASPSGDEKAILSQIARLSLLNESGALLYDSRRDEAAGILLQMDQWIAQAITPPAPPAAAANPMSGAPGALPPHNIGNQGPLAAAASSSPTGTSLGPDGQWSIAYYERTQANDRAGCISLLDRLSQTNGGDLPPIDAHTLARIALYGTPHEIRDHALEVIESSFSTGPEVLLMLADNILPDRRDGLLSQTIEHITSIRLPGVDDPSWFVKARSALLDRAMVLRGDLKDASNPAVDRLGWLIVSAYEHQANILTHRGVGAISPAATATPAAADSGETGGSDTSGVTPSLAVSTNQRIPDNGGRGTPEIAREPAQAAWKCFDAWMLVAQPMVPSIIIPAPLEVIRQSAQARRQLFPDPIGAFLAAQTSVLDAAAYVTAAERPIEADDIRRVLDNATRERALARTDLEQLLVTEKAINLIWQIRLTGESAGVLTGFGSVQSDTSISHLSVGTHTDPGAAADHGGSPTGTSPPTGPAGGSATGAGARGVGR